MKPSIRNWLLGCGLGFGFALAVAAGLSDKPGSLSLLLPRVGPGHRQAVSATQTCWAESNGAYNWTTNPCQMVPWNAALTINAISGGTCACFSLTASVAIGSGTTCGDVVDANDGNAAVIGNCFEVIQGQIVDVTPARAWFSRAGVGRRTGHCTSSSRPCAVNGDCMANTGPCIGGGVGSPSSSVPGAYLLLEATGAGAVFIGNSVGE